MGFWSSLLVAIIGGIFTAVMVAAAGAFYTALQEVRRHDAQVADLEEDNRRWFRDHEAQRTIDERRTLNELAAQGHLYDGVLLTELAHVRHQLLREYLRELSLKRGLYRALRAAEGREHEFVRDRRSTPFPRFGLTDGLRMILASWRADVAPASRPDATQPVDDPTSEALEPDLRRFEVEGDPPF